MLVNNKHANGTFHVSHARATWKNFAVWQRISLCWKPTSFDFLKYCTRFSGSLFLLLLVVFFNDDSVSLEHTLMKHS